MINKPFLTPLNIIENPKGKIKHGLKCVDDGFSKFGEAYFTEIHQDVIKGWKKHTKMTLNLIVPMGNVIFFVHDETLPSCKSFTIGDASYKRLTIPPNYWVAFKGLSKKNLILNIANIPHDPLESVTVDLNHFKEILLW